jgi:hypothetical protein
MTDLKKFKIAGDAVLAALDAVRDAYAARDAYRTRDVYAARDAALDAARVAAHRAADLAARDAAAALRDTYTTYNAILATLAAKEQETSNE